MRGWLLMVALLLGLNPASGAGLRDLDDAWLVSGPAAGRLLGLPEHRWWLHAGQGQLYGLAELRQLAVGLERRSANWRFRLGWQELGSGIYDESCIGGEVLIGHVWRWGLVGEYRQLEVGERRSAASLWLTVSGTLAGAGRWRLDWPLTTPPDWSGPRRLTRWLRWQQQGAQVAAAVVIDRRGDGTPVVAVEILPRVAGGVAWGVRFDGASRALGPITVWRRGSLIVRSSHLAHPQLGLSHRWSLGVSR